MNQLLNTLLPHVISNINELIKCFWESIYMIGITGAISLCFGVIFGVILVVTRPGNIFANNVIFSILGKVINIFRSIPFIILLAALIPLTRVLMGTGIGTKGALVPLIFGTVPFFSRQIETALLEVDKGLIEAAQAMGSSPLEIVFRVYLRESIPGMIRATTITFISLIGLSAMAGAVGGGGLGDFAIRYGYQRFQDDVTFITVIILLILVSVIQGIGNIIVKKTTH